MQDRVRRGVVVVAWALVFLLVTPLLEARRMDEGVHLVVRPGRGHFALILPPDVGDPTVTGARVDLDETTETWAPKPSFPFLGATRLRTLSLTDADPGGALAVRLGARTWSTLYPSPLNQSLRVAFLGDTGTGPDAAAHLARVAAQEPDLVIHLGDVAYAYGDEAAWRDWTRLVATHAPGIPFAYTPGNHDIETRLDRFFTRALVGDTLPYSFDAGPVHFIALDGNHVREEDAPWIENDLQAARDAGTPWLVAVQHQPWWSSSLHHGSTLDAQTLHTPLFTTLGLELALAGHEHNYERISHDDGPTYVVAGGGGAPLHDTFSKEPPPWSRIRTARHGFLLVQFYTDRAHAKALDADGAIIDEFTLTPTPPTAR